MVDVLPGFREFYPENCFLRNFVFEKIRQVCRHFCFVEYDAPILEPLELFTEKSGEEIVDQLFAFTDRGGRAVALRPEMTPSVARMIGSKINALKRPLKWFSIEENFRYERPQKGRLRSFYQLNIDIFDEHTLDAEGEIIALTIAILQSFGLSSDEVHLRLSDRCLWSILLQMLHVPEDLSTTVLSIIDKIERTTFEEIIEQFNKLALNGVLLLEKIREFKGIQDLQGLEKFFNQLPQSPGNLLEKVTLRLDQLKVLMSLLDHKGLKDFITLDLGIVRGLAYYTGFVFEVFERSGKSRAIAGGGRYDHLIEKFGYPQTAAVGLAIGDVTLMHMLQEKNLLPAFEQKCDLFVIFDAAVKHLAMYDVHQLRLAGFSVNYTFKENVALDKQFRQALQQAHWIATYQDGKSFLVLKDLAHRKDYEISRQEIISFLQKQNL